MAKKCAVCGESASFLLGGGDFRGKTLCYNCHKKAANAKSDEELEAMGFNSEESSYKEQYEGSGFINGLRVLAWINLVISFILIINMWSEGSTFRVGLMIILISAIIFTVLYVLSIIAENVIAIRMNLESKGKADK